LNLAATAKKVFQENVTEASVAAAQVADVQAILVLKKAGAATAAAAEAEIEEVAAATDEVAEDLTAEVAAAAKGAAVVDLIGEVAAETENLNHVNAAAKADSREEAVAVVLITNHVNAAAVALTLNPENAAVALTTNHVKEKQVEVLKDAAAEAHQKAMDLRRPRDLINHIPHQADQQKGLTGLKEEKLSLEVVRRRRGSS